MAELYPNFNFIKYSRYESFLSINFHIEHEFSPFDTKFLSPQISFRRQNSQSVSCSQKEGVRRVKNDSSGITSIISKITDTRVIKRESARRKEGISNVGR